MQNLIELDLEDGMLLGEATALTTGLWGMWPEHGGTQEARAE
jgi:hypothetical protein